jgi:hypothetical protein
MTQLLLSENIYYNDDSEGEDMQANLDEVENYKGMYQNEEEELEQKEFEGGAHFPYQVLYHKLQELKKKLDLERVDTTENSSKKNHLVNSRESVNNKGI